MLGCLIVTLVREELGYSLASKLGKVLSLEDDVEQQEQFTSMLSKQLDNKRNQSITALGKIETIVSSNQLNKFFGTVLKSRQVGSNS